MNPKYQIASKLNAFDQLNIARKLSAAFPLIKAVVDKENDGKDKSILVVMALGMLSDSNSQYVMEKCLSTIVKVQDSGALAKVFSNGNLMFDDLTLQDITEITAEVIEENLGNFLNTALSGLEAD